MMLKNNILKLFYSVSPRVYIPCPLFSHDRLVVMEAPPLELLSAVLRSLSEVSSCDAALGWHQLSQCGIVPQARAAAARNVLRLGRALYQLIVNDRVMGHPLLYRKYVLAKHFINLLVIFHGNLQ